MKEETMEERFAEKFVYSDLINKRKPFKNIYKLRDDELGEIKDFIIRENHIAVQQALTTQKETLIKEVEKMPFPEKDILCGYSKTHVLKDQVKDLIKNL
jgi:hypothetical protein